MERKCVICNERKEENIMILGKHICADCEWKLVVARVHDEGYRDYAEAVKRMLARNQGA